MYVVTLRHALQASYSVEHLTWVGSECYLPSKASQAFLWLERHLASILRPGDILAVAVASFKLIQPGLYGGRRGPSPEHRVRLYIRWLKRYQRVALSAKAALLILGDSAKLPSSGSACKPTPFRPNAARACMLNRTQVETSRSLLNQQHDALMKEPGVIVFDPSLLFCGWDTCGALIPGTNKLAYVDRHHWNPAGSLYVSPFLCSFLSEHGVVFEDKATAVAHSLSA